MKDGDFVYFIDGHGKIRKGNLKEKVTVVGEVDAEAFMNGWKDFEKVNKEEWEIETLDGQFCVEEKDISLEPILQ